MHKYQYIYEVITPKISDSRILSKFVPISPRKAGPYFLIRDSLIDIGNDIADIDVGEKTILVTFMYSDKDIGNTERWSVKW